MRRFLAFFWLLLLLSHPAAAEISNLGSYPVPPITTHNIPIFQDTSGHPLLDSGIGTVAGRITPVADPVNPLDAANKEYVDAIAAGFTPPADGPALVATTANLNATYANGTAGVGATLTNAGSQAAIVIDGVSLSSSDSVLVKNQTTTFQNGIYTVTTVGTISTNWVLTRRTDFDQASEVKFGAIVALSEGTAQSGTVWFESGAGPFTIGSTPIIFSQFNGSGSIGCAQLPALTGDTTTSAGSCATITGKVDGVTYPSGPSVNTVPVVTSSAAGGTVTYEAVPNAALANTSITVNSVPCTLGTSCTVPAGLSGLTTNVLTKATSASTIGDSSITDNGTTVSTTEIVGTGGVGITTGDATQTIVNNTVATVLHKLVILASGAYQATVATTGSTTNVIGVCDGGCANTGSATVAWAGLAQCIFDGATTAGDWVVASTGTAGDCHDAGSTVPTTVQVLGQVTSTNGGAGTYSLDLNPVGVASAINAKTSPGGTNGQIQFNSSGNFGGFTASGGATINTSTGVVTLGNPGASTLGGIESFAAVSHQWINTISTSGVPSATQPAIGDLASVATNTYLGNPTSGSAAPAATAISGCSGNNHASQYTTNTGFTCATDVADLDVADQTVSGGANVTSQSKSTGNITVDCGARPLQFITNGGAFTVTAPTADGSCLLMTTNNGSAGTISFSGFSVGSNTGDTLDTTNAHIFTLFIWRINGTSGYRVAAAQ